MGKLYDKLTEDYRIKEGLKACINCGTCTAICPAAEFYKYEPRRMTAEEKDAVSHRGRSLRAFSKVLETYLQQGE